MKKTICILLSILLTLSLFSGCSKGGVVYPEGAETVVFTDSCGREVELPADITRIAPSGVVATMLLATIAPEYLVSASSTPSSSQYPYLPEELMTLSTTGQLYGSKSTINLEALLAAEPQVIIDLGDPKEDIAADLDALQQQTGIPVIFIEADLDSMAAAYRSLGSLLSGKGERGEELAALVDETVSMAQNNSAEITDDRRISIMYTSGTTGLNTNAAGSIQAQVIDLVGADNAVVVEEVSNKGGGNTVSLEQMYVFDPDVVLFASGSIYDTCAADPAWAQLGAISRGDYCEIPGLPYNWLSNPPSVNMLLGVWWLGNLLYPEVYDYDMAQQAQRIYKLLWNYDLSDEEAAEMLARGSFN